MWNVQVECHSQSTGPGLNAVAAAGSHRNISTGDGMIWEVDSETRTISEHSDIDLRGKLQKQRIKEFCRRHIFVGEQLPSDPPTAKLFYRHLIFEEHSQSLFCFVPKIGCTNMKRLMLYMGGHLPLDTLDWPWVEDSKYLEPALKHASLMNVTLTTAQRLKIMHTYYKFMIVRNPLERIVSGYRNKIEPPLDFKKQDSFPHKVKKEILMRFRLPQFLQWQQISKTRKKNITVSFSDFVHYLTNTATEALNEHFQGSMDICHPCVVDYDFYGNFRNYSHDARALIKKFKTNPRYYRDESLHSTGDETARLLPYYYDQLTFREKVKLLGVMYDELAFYYTLYPSERFSHTSLLGVDIPIL